jgi:hypothetical protein
MGRFEEAVTSCRMAVRLVPAFSEARSELALALADLGLAGETRAVVDSLRKLAPYDAIRVAVRLGTDAGRVGISVAKRVSFRQQALQGLKEHMKRRQEVVETDAGQREPVVKELELWRADQTFALVRDPSALDGLPATEREEWQAFWAEVEAVLAGLR